MVAPSLLEAGDHGLVSNGQGRSSCGCIGHVGFTDDRGEAWPAGAPWCHNKDWLLEDVDNILTEAGFSECEVQSRTFRRGAIALVTRRV